MRASCASAWRSWASPRWLLVLSRSEGARAEVVEVDAAAVLRSRAVFWEPVAAERAEDLVVAGAEERARAQAVAGALEQVVDNPVANALEVAPDGTAFELAVQDRDSVVLTVADRGPGMPAEERARAFDRLWQGRHRTRRSGARPRDSAAAGAGLGRRGRAAAARGRWPGGVRDAARGAIAHPP